MSHPAAEAGERSASAFRQSLGAQLDNCCALASSIAVDWGGMSIAEHGLLGASSFRSPGQRVASLGAAGGGHSGDGADASAHDNAHAGVGHRDGGGADAPAYDGARTSSNAESWMNFAQEDRDKGGLGLTRAQAAGVVGNLEHESGPGIAPSGVTGDHGTAHGAAQWRNERYAALRQKSQEWGLDPKSTAAQQRFMRYELDHSEQGADRALRAATTPEQAADAFNRHYERSADPGRGRRATARRRFERDENQAAAPPPIIANPTAAAPAGDLRASPGRRPDMRHVDPRLREIMAAAATHLPPGYSVGVNEGYNSGGHVGNSQHHVAGRGALDLQITDPQGRSIPNRGRDTTGMYTRLGRAGYGEMLARYPDLDGHFAHGASFGKSRGSNVPDLMHFDLGGERGHLAPHLSKLGPLPGEHYGVPKTEQTAKKEDDK